MTWELLKKIFVLSQIVILFAFEISVIGFLVSMMM